MPPVCYWGSFIHHAVLSNSASVFLPDRRGFVPALWGGRFRRGGWRQGRGYGYMPAFADRIRHMSDDEYNQFKQRFEQGGRCSDYASQKAPESPTNETPTNV
ncbi:hypothetical protein GO730_03170 [Spirosoma sp. HMF3257]|uniref:Uncharacterized protein n=1 Tax=Spirosoma telluris TaxID=2183553 RepID=A0A327NEC9_9BACT|nr:hypothetical protein [Spirosoma telluris]RAI73660.1 hypothetical protein HMF3257_03100 [Spirosoma telluris]